MEPTDENRSPAEVIGIYEDSAVDPSCKFSNTMLKYCNLYNRMKWTVEDIEEETNTRA